jgi:hypothetical protein
MAFGVFAFMLYSYADLNETVLPENRLSSPSSLSQQGMKFNRASMTIR